MNDFSYEESARKAIEEERKRKKGKGLKTVKLFWDNVEYYESLLDINRSDACRSDIRGRNVSLTTVRSIAEALDMPMSKLLDDIDENINDTDAIATAERKNILKNMGVSQEQVKDSIGVLKKINKFLKENNE